MYYYIISRAFIPPWSLVMTRPETLGPGISYLGNRNPSFSLHQLHCLDPLEQSTVLAQVQHITNYKIAS